MATHADEADPDIEQNGQGGPVLDLPTEFTAERLEALCAALARVLALRARQTMRAESANDNY